MSKTKTQRTPALPDSRQGRVRWRGSVQQHFVRIRHIYDHMLCLSTASGVSYDFINVLAVEGISYDLKSAEEQMLLNEQFQSLLAGMSQDVQIMWRVSPLNLGDYLRQFEVNDDAAAEEIWRLLSSSHADFLQALGQRRTLLKREIYVLLRTNSFGQAVSQAQRWLRTRTQRRVRWSQQVEQARQDLDLQAGEMMRLLGDMNLSVRRLRGVEELTPFYYRCLRPTQAQQFPLHADIIQAIDQPILAPQSPQVQVEEVPDAQQALITVEPSKRAPAAERALVDPPLTFTQLADLVAPAAMTIGPDYLTIEKELTRTLVVQNVPRSVFPGWLKPLADLDEPMEISFHLHPHSSESVMPQLRRQYRAYRSSQLLANQKGNDADPDTQIAGGDVGALLLRLASGAERLLTVSVVILLRAPSKRLLNERTARLQAVLHSMLLVAREALFEQDRGFRTCLPHGRCEMPGLLLDSRSASTFFPFLSNSLFHEHGVLEGITPQGDPVIFDAWGEGMANANRIILGPPGWGKSHSIKSMLIRLALKYHCLQALAPEKGLPFQAILIDHEQEYGHISTTLGGQTIRLSPGSAQHLNPFDLPQRGKEAGTSMKIAWRIMSPNCIPC
ncbi:VirB4 family type IV secretion system protein [Dictyobacter formicarum]|uniref:Helicase HerA central domain-containing protein n=1 Tax=Dictyobacter formicarum TaxID=2778368 RepID=A0ABQ3VSQ4_9CHLR|nr:hypothetical protein [Dictyobacter formicarum]GHO88156.1 hypothetical protein KSZ_61620 [Dictyobacter formicarum]